MSSSIQKIKNQLTNKFSLDNLKLLKLKKETKITSLIGLDINHNGLRVVEISNKAGTPVVTFLDGFDYEDNLEDDNFNIQKTEAFFSGFNARFVNSVIKSPQVKLEFKRFPYVDTKELEKILEVETEKESPNQEKVITDYVVLGEVKDKKGNKLLVLLVTVPKKDVYKHIALIESFSLDPFYLEIEPLAFSRLLKFNKQLEEGKFYVVVNIGSREVSVSLHKGEQLYLYRNFYSVGESNVVKAISDELGINSKQAIKIKKDINLDTIYKSTSDTDKQIFSSINSIIKKRVIELERSIQYFTNTYPAVDIEKVFLSGINLVKGIDNYIGKKIELPIEFINPFRNLSFDENLKTDFDEYSFSVSTGLALRSFIE